MMLFSFFALLHLLRQLTGTWMPACIIAYLISYVVLHYARFRLRRLPAYGQLQSRRTNKQQQQDPVEHPVLTKLQNPRVLTYVFQAGA